MSKAVAGFDRFIVLLLALGLAFLGVWSILVYLNNPYAVELTEYRNAPIWLSATKTSWFEPLLWAITLGCLIVGLWIIVINIRRRRIRKVDSASASSEVGTISFNLSQIAQAVSADLEATPKVNRVKSLVAFDRGRPTMELSVEAAAEANISSLVQQLAQAEADVRAAIGDADVDTSFRLHLAPINRDPELVRVN